MNMCECLKMGVFEERRLADTYGINQFCLEGRPPLYMQVPENHHFFGLLQAL